MLAQLCDRRLNGHLGVDPSLAAQQQHPYYRCAKCRYFIYKNRSLKRLSLKFKQAYNTY